MSQLNAADVDRLMSNRSAVTRSHIAVRIASLFRQDTLSRNERRIAEDIVRAFAGDAAVRVRKAVSYNLKRCPFLPRDIAMRIAEDVESVAIPFLEVSEALTDADLMRIVRGHGTAKQVAIARRPAVSADVAEVLVGTQNEHVILSLVSNRGAAIADPSLNRIVDGFADNAAVTEAMVHRPELPLAVSSRLIAHVSDSLRLHLVEHHRLPEDLAEDIARMGRERTLLDLVPDGDDRARAEIFVGELCRNDQLTPTLLLRALCGGRVTLFEAGMAALAGMPADRTRRLIRDAWPYGFEGVFRTAELPRPLLPAFRAAFQAVTAPGGGDRSKCGRHQRLVQALSAEYGILGTTDIETMLGGLAHQLRDHPESTPH